MSQLKISLLGKISISKDGEDILFSRSQTVLELLSYLLIFHDRPHHRERLADLIWGECGVDKSKQYLRKTLYNLKASLSAIQNLDDSELLLIEPEWLQINLGENIWLDAAEFEHAFDSVCEIHSYDLNESTFITLREAVDLYRGDLLDGWYQDWCIFERERYREMLFSILNKMMGFCELTNRFSLGIKYGNVILRHERANERTHRRIMRLFYLAGDRTSAINQFDYLNVVLEEELAVKPSRRTSDLYYQILSGENLDDLREPTERQLSSNRLGKQAQASLQRIRKLISEQQYGQQRLLREIQALIRAIK